jgi:hypothetical protein
MKSGPPKKNKPSDKSQAKEHEPLGASQVPESQKAAASGDSSAQEVREKRSGSAGKQSRQDRSKRLPPVRIVSDLSGAEAVVPRKEQARTKRSDGSAASPRSTIPPERIAERAYALYEAAGYEQGREVEHWLEAERQLEAEEKKREGSTG